MVNSFALVDSGATHHAVNSLTRLTDCEFYPEPIQVTVANGSTMRAVAKGSITLHTGKHTLVISDVLYMPDLKYNILSVSAFTAKGFGVSFIDKYAYVYDATDCTQTILTAKLKQGLFIANVHDSAANRKTVPIIIPSVQEMHAQRIAPHVHTAAASTHTHTHNTHITHTQA